MSTQGEEELLSGVRVLDLGQGIAGPYCAAILQQQGAEVIKVEPPQGDWARKMGLHREGFSAVVLVCNAGKSGLCVDAGTDAGQAVLARVATACDVVVQNFRAGVADRLGLGYEALSSHHAGLVYVSISGFGGDGPWAHRPATDNVLQAVGGIMHANRGADGVPSRVGLYLADLATAIYAAQAVCAALYRKAVSGRGRHLSISLLEACCALQASHIADTVFAEGARLPRSATAPSGIFAVKDGHVTLATLDDGMFHRLCGALEMEGVAEDGRAATNALRLQNADWLNARVSQRLATETLGSAQRRLEAADVLCAPVLDYPGLLAHPQVRHLQLFGSVGALGLDVVPLPRMPGSLPGAASRQAPVVGQHSLEVLARLGFAQAEIAALVAAGVVRQAG